MMKSLTCSSIAIWCRDSPRCSRTPRRYAPGCTSLSTAMTAPLELLRLGRGRELLDQLLGDLRGAGLVAEGTLDLQRQVQGVGTLLRGHAVEALDEGARLQVLLLLVAQRGHLVERFRQVRIDIDGLAEEVLRRDRVRHRGGAQPGVGIGRVRGAVVGVAG